MPPVAARFERPIVLPVREGLDPDAGLRERLVGLTAPFVLSRSLTSLRYVHSKSVDRASSRCMSGSDSNSASLSNWSSDSWLKSEDMSRVSCGILAIFNRLRTKRSLRPVFSAISLTCMPRSRSPW